MSTETAPRTPSRRLSNFHLRTTPLPRHRSSSNLNFTPSSSRRVTLLETPKKSTPRRQSLAGPRSRKLTRDEIAHMYSSTIKLCQDNKINSKNTWSLNLIDYMAMLVRGGARPSIATPNDQPGDTNFQLAGVTLDAGVRIYCSRVDSVHTNAFKVLGGLSRSGGENVGDEEGDESDNGDRKKKSTRRMGRNTLETNMANITVQKLETDLAVDPLFQKMSAAFDEGGAAGMLMNNLPIGPDAHIIFDSSEPASSLVSGIASEGKENIEVTYDVSASLGSAPTPSDILCPSFLRYYKVVTGQRDTATNISESSPAMPPLLASESPFEYVDDDLSTGPSSFPPPASFLESDSPFPYDNDNDTIMDEDEVNLGRPSTEPRASMDSRVSLGPSPHAVDLIEAGAALSGDSYNFFDASLRKTWAGPQHWQFRKNETTSTKKEKRPRGKKAALLDFHSEAVEVGFEKEFVPSKYNGLSANVRSVLSEKKVTLPEDLQYSARRLMSLFLKPKAVVRVRNVEKAGEVFVDALYDFDNDCDNDNACLPDVNDDEPFGAAEKEMDYGMDLVKEPVCVEQIDINYAKVAKKVDVRQLKSGIWSKLCDTEEEGTNKPEDGNESSQRNGAQNDIRTGASQRLQDIVSDIDSVVPTTAAQDVSLPYIFICLLHLANEKTLDISQADEGLNDLIITASQKGE